jgi:hypothetical protein
MIDLPFTYTLSTLNVSNKTIDLSPDKSLKSYRMETTESTKYLFTNYRFGASVELADFP